MALSTFIPEVWAARILEKLNKNLVFAQGGVINRDYEPEVSTFGDTVHIFGLDPVAVRTYTRDTDITTDLLTGDGQDLLIDQQKYFSFYLDDVDKAQQLPKVMDSATANAGYELSDVADILVATRMTAGAATTIDDGAGAPIVLEVSNFYDLLVDASIELDENNVPSAGRFAVLPPFAVGVLQRDSDFIAVGGEQVLFNGQVGMAAGFNILKSNNTKSLIGPPAGNSLVLGHPIATTFADQLVEVEGIRHPSRFGDIVRGLHVYGCKVTRPEALYVIEGARA